MPYARAAVLALLCPALSACGGGSGDGGGGGGSAAPRAKFNGTYFHAHFEGNVVAPPTAIIAGEGLSTADGNGATSIDDATSNSSGTLGDPAPVAGTYTIGNQFAATLTHSGVTNTGGLTSDGAVMLTSATAVGSRPRMDVLLRREGAFTLASLAGTYHVGGWRGGPGVGRQSFWGTMTFDGAGAVTAASVSLNTAGVVSGPTGGTGTYTVAADGTCTVTHVPTFRAVRGGILSGGQVAVLAGGQVAGQAPALVVLIKQSAGLLPTVLNGSYWICGLKCQDAPNWTQFTSFDGTMFCNGVSAFNYVSTTENWEGAIATPSGNDGYALQPDGTLFTSGIGAGGPFRQGAVSGDGRFAFLSGTIVGGGPPLFFFLVRK